MIANLDKTENDFDQYQRIARETAVYSRWTDPLYPFLGLAGETGEVCETIKKQVRDYNSDFTNPEFRLRLHKELGDVLWYLANIATDFHFHLSEIAKGNLEKLQDRRERGKIHGKGNER